MAKSPKTVSLILSDTLDVYRNQATELSVFETTEPDELCLFLWTNENTVVIGRNQDALTECKVDLLVSDGGSLARRLSGGGAVYHDRGNLNFTFCGVGNSFSKETNYQIVFEAMRVCGFDVELSGRNDLTIDGKKFSGNAYYNDGERHLHHGTILIEADCGAMSRYLTPSVEKLKTKGVASVESRVINLKTLNSEFDKNIMTDALICAFKKHFPNANYIQKSVEDLSPERLSKNLDFFAQRKWILGEQVCYNLHCKVRFDFGLCDVRCFEKNGVIKTAKIFSDSLEIEKVGLLEKLLIGLSIYRYDIEDMQCVSFEKELDKRMKSKKVGELEDVIENSFKKEDLDSLENNKFNRPDDVLNKGFKKEDIDSLENNKFNGLEDEVKQTILALRGIV